MITAVSHLAFATDDLESAAADYEVLLDCRAERLQAADGKLLCRFQLSNIAFEISAAEGRGEGLKSIGFEAVDLDGTVRSSAGAASTSAPSPIRRSAQRRRPADPSACRDFAHLDARRSNDDR